MSVEMTAIPAGWEAISDSLYDFEEVTIGDTIVDFFMRPMGTVGKTDADTNMYLSMRLPDGVEFLIKEVELVFVPLVLSRTREVYEDMAAARAAFRLQIADKTYVSGFLGRFMRPWKIRRTVEQSVIEETESCPWASGPFFMGSMLYLSGVSKQNFVAQVRWDLPGSPQSGRIGVVLHGLRYRRSA